MWKRNSSKCVQVLTGSHGIQKLDVYKDYIVHGGEILKLWKKSTGESRELKGYQGGVGAMVVDGDIIACGGDKRIRMWKIHGGEYKDLDVEIKALRFKVERDYIIAKRGGDIRIWNLHTGKCEGKFKTSGEI